MMTLCNLRHLSKMLLQPTIDFIWNIVKWSRTALIHNISIQYDVEPLRMGAIQFRSLILHIVNQERTRELLHFPQIICSIKSVCKILVTFYLEIHIFKLFFFHRMSLLHINCEKSGFTGKPVMDLVDPSQVDHEGGSGARPEVDHEGLARHSHIQQVEAGPSVWVMDNRVGGWTKLSSCLVKILPHNIEGSSYLFGGPEEVSHVVRVTGDPVFLVILCDLILSLLLHVFNVPLPGRGTNPIFQSHDYTQNYHESSLSQNLHKFYPPLHSE